MMSWNLLAVRCWFDYRKRGKVEWTELRAHRWWMVPDQSCISTDRRFRSNHPQAGFSSGPLRPPTPTATTHSHTHTQQLCCTNLQLWSPWVFFSRPSEDSCMEHEGKWLWAAGRRYRKESSNTVLWFHLIINKSKRHRKRCAARSKVQSQSWFPSIPCLRRHVQLAATLVSSWPGTRYVLR